MGTGGYIILGIVLCVVFYLIHKFASKKLQPLSFKISKIINIFLTPLILLWKLIDKGIKKLIKRYVKIDVPELSSFGGFSQVVFMIFCALFSLIVFICTLFNKSVDSGDLIGDLLINLPIFGIVDVAISGVFKYEKLVEITLSSVLFVVFMKNNDCENKFVNILYDLIFTGFFTCVSFVIPNSVYALPLKAFPLVEAAVNMHSDIAVINFFAVIASVIVAIISVYIIASVYLLAIREVISSIAFSLFPFSVLVTAVIIISSLQWSGFWSGIVLIVLAFLATFWMGISRADAEESYEKQKTKPLSKLPVTTTKHETFI